jgi:hypothetical protein
MLIRKGLNIPRERNSKNKKRSDEKGTSYKDSEGHPYVGYIDGDVFVPNSKTVEAFNEVECCLSIARNWGNRCVHGTSEVRGYWSSGTLCLCASY